MPFTNFDTSKVEQYILQNGDILFARTGATVGKSYLVQEVPLNSIYASYLIRIRTSNEIYPKYLKLFFESGYYWQQISEGSVGIGQPNVNGTSLGQLLLPVPPKAEQIRIINRAESLMKLISSIDVWTVNLSRSIEQTKNKILDLAMQGKLVPQNPMDEPAADMLLRINPKAKIITDNPHYPSWVSTQLGDVCDFERGITFPSAAKEHIKTTNNIACLRTANIHDEVDLTSLWFVEKTFLKGNHNKIIRLGDIIMSTANSRELVGRSVIIKTCEEEMTFGGFVTAIRTNILAPEFLQLFLKYKTTKGEFSKIATQTTNIANLNTKILSSVYISFPCLLGQKRIVAKIEELYSIIDSIEASLQS